MIIRWFYSKTVREACAMRKHVHHLMCAQRDILTPPAIGGVTLAMNQLRDTVAAGENIGKIRIKMDELDFAANKWLKPYPNALWRENVEVVLVAVAAAMAIRTFFVQPFKIPTGSMQPTLYGVVSTPDYTRAYAEAQYGMEDQAKADSQKQLQLQKSMLIPAGWERIKEWFQGVSYVRVVAQASGTVDGSSIGPMHRFLIFNLWQSFWIGGVEHTMWFPPDYGEEDLPHRAGMFLGREYHKGDEVVKLRVSAGDHLFVDRLTYNFRKPDRGEIIVFDTHGIDRLSPDQQNTFYIKRLVGLGGETLALAQDYEVTGAPQFGGETVPVGHLVVDGQPLSASTPHFENLYSFSGVRPGTRIFRYQDNQYCGHALIRALEPGHEFQVETNHYFVMGDNTMDSSDSRFWGDFPSGQVVGKSFFVYWPITKRFGWGNQ
jgi:signal peptidase I